MTGLRKETVRGGQKMRMVFVIGQLIFLGFAIGYAIKGQTDMTHEMVIMVLLLQIRARQET